MSMDHGMEPPSTAPVTARNDIDISAMTEEEQIAYALQMSMTPDGKS